MLSQTLTRALVLVFSVVVPLYPAVAADEGIDYSVLPTPQATETGDQIEVVEVFFYGCPHCWHIEPQMNDWVAKLPEGVAFRRMPATGPRWTPHARAYYAAESLGVLDALHEPLFEAMHEKKRRIVDKDDLIKFAAEVGIDPDKFSAAYDSFYVEAKTRKATEMGRRYGIDGVPAVIVNGKYRTSPSQTGGQDKMFKVLDDLVAKELGASAAGGAAN